MATSDLTDSGYTVSGADLNLIPPPDDTIANEAESWLGYALATLATAVVCFFIAPAFVPVMLAIGAVVAFVAVAKTTTAVIDYMTGKLGLKPDAPLPTAIKKAQWLFWLVLAIAALLYFAKRRRGSR